MLYEGIEQFEESNKTIICESMEDVKYIDFLVEKWEGN